MMSVDRKEIDLIIRAALQGGKTLDNVVKSIGDIEKALDAQVKAAKRGETSIDDLKATLLSLQAAQDQLKDQAGLIGQFQRLTEQIAKSEEKAASAAKTYTEYKAKIDALGNTTEAQANRLIRLGSASERTQQTLARQKTEHVELTGVLKTAGIATDKLTESEVRARQAAAQLGVSMVAVRDAMSDYGKAVTKPVDAHALFASSGRTTLSLFQRIRGELLSVTASWIGLYGAMNNAKEVITSYNEQQALLNQLSISTGGDKGLAAKEFKYVAEQSDRLGINLEEAAKGYAKFSAAATFAGRSVQENRFVFESVAEVGRVAGLTKEQLARVFYAISQIDSKGKVMAEEFNQQLGDSLPGLTGVAKKATEGMFDDFNKAMKDGKVGLNVFVDILAKYRDLVSGQLPTAISSLQANQERLNNEIFKFKLSVADAGFANEFGKLVARLTVFFQSDDGPKFAAKLSDALSSVVNGLIWCVEHVESLKQILYFGLGVVGVKALLGLGYGVIALHEKMILLAASTGGAALASKALYSALGILGAFAAGWSLGKILSDNFLEVRLAGIALVVGLEKSWAYIKFGAKVLWQEVPAIFLDGFALLSNHITEGVRQLLGVFSSAARAIGKSEFADAIDKVVSSITFKTGRIGVATKQLKKELEADLASIEAIGNSMADDQISDANPSPRAKKKYDKTAKPAPTPEKLGDDDEKRLKVKSSLENELAAISAKIDRQEKDNLESRLRAIDTAYLKLAKKIRAFGGADGDSMMKTLEADVTELKLQETRKFNEALVKEQNELRRALEVVDARVDRRSKTDLDKRLKAVQESYEKTYRDIEAYRLKLSTNSRDTQPADEMKARLDAGVAALQNLERIKYYEDSVNKILEERKAKLDVILVQEKVGILTATQAREEASKVVTDTQPRIEALVKAGLEYVDAMREVAIASGNSTVALDTMKAKLIEARESASGVRTSLLSAAQANEMLANGATTAFQTMSSAIWDAISGVKTWREAIAATGKAFAKFAGDFIMQIAQMIMKQAILNALKSSTAGSTGGFGGAVSSAVTAASQMHSGGVVGVGGVSRSAISSWFDNAPRYHGGGIAGLAPDEYPAILKRNEEVLTQSDPRNVLNSGSGGKSATPGIKVINMIDSGSVVSEGLSSQEGERAIFNFIRANRTGLKSLLT
jgi:tape measure domain-containing protein